MLLTVSEVTELRLSVPEAGKRFLPLPVAAWHATVGAKVLAGIAKGDPVLVTGQLVRRFYRSGAGARSLTEVVARSNPSRVPSIAHRSPGSRLA